MDIEIILKEKNCRKNRIRRNLVSANISLITCSLWDYDERNWLA